VILRDRADSGAGAEVPRFDIGSGRRCLRAGDVRVSQMGIAVVRVVSLSLKSGRKGFSHFHFSARNGSKVREFVDMVGGVDWDSGYSSFTVGPQMVVFPQ
jgi:hypothetical protein